MLRQQAEEAMLNARIDREHKVKHQIAMNKLKAPAIDKFTTRKTVVYGRGSASVTDSRFDAIENDYENLSQY
jgi:hypothetical protein